MTHFDIKRERKEINSFVDILHQLPINERRSYVWKIAFKALKNRSLGTNISATTTPNNQTIGHLMNNTIERYKVKVILNIH